MFLLLLQQVNNMAYLLPHLHSGYAVDQAILNENDRIVVLRFGRDWVPECMMMDKTLSRIAELVKNFAVVYLVDLDEVPDFNKVSNNLNIFYRRCKSAYLIIIITKP
jgi:thiol-disulfide isomerase/thioredoxin